MRTTIAWIVQGFLARVFLFHSIFYTFGPEPVVRSMRGQGKWPPAIPKWLRILCWHVVPLSPVSLVLLEPRRNQPLNGQKINQVVDVRGPAAPDAPADAIGRICGKGPFRIFISSKVEGRKPIAKNSVSANPGGSQSGCDSFGLAPASGKGEINHVRRAKQGPHPPPL